MKLFKTKDDDEWFKYRRQHLTSTELASLHLIHTARNWQELRRQKESGERWGGNQYTEWGKARELKLAPLFADIDSRLNYNEDPQTIIINEADERLCGTPDLFSEDGAVIGEIKTANHEFTGGMFHDWCPDQYYLQVQANTWHAGAEACVLLVEYYREEDGQFTPFECETRVIEYDPETVETMRQTAAEWFAWLDGQTPEWMVELSSLDDVDELEDLVAQYADADAKAKSWAELKEQYRTEILAKVGRDYAGQHGGFKVSVSTAADSMAFDSTKFKKTHPDLYREYATKKRRGATRLILTRVKE